MLFPNANLSQRGNQMLPSSRNYLARRGEFDSLPCGITSQGEGNLTPFFAELPRKEREI